VLGLAVSVGAADAPRFDDEVLEEVLVFVEGEFMEALFALEAFAGVALVGVEDALGEVFNILDVPELEGAVHVGHRL
jgi:hypothetical protein